MSNWIRQYILSVTSAAIICAVIRELVGQKSGYLKVINLIAGIFLTVTVVAPWSKLEIDEFENYIQGFSADAESVVSIGEAYRQEEMSRLIKSQTEAYILDKADSLGIALQADVIVADSDPIIPYSVTVYSGSIAPYKREQLKQYIANELAIPEARQTWI